MGCGLCCDGTLFLAVPVEDDDPLEALRAAGIPLRQHQRSRSFTQPCPALRAGRCVAYASRPAACRAYRCHTLAGATEGTLSWEEAEKEVERAVTLRRRIEEALERLLGPAPHQAMAERMVEALQRLEDADDLLSARREHAGLLLDVSALGELVARSFSPARDAHATTTPANKKVRA
ncbi:MAG: YkgJ family cysteine cluster protein, partial [Armatimonadota bacterium]|nr:YkgJ family cysteine cluster protein [Armatimonadota bacterium]